MAVRRGTPNQTTLRRVGSAIVGLFGATISGLSFWIAVLLPLVYIPLVLTNQPWVTDFSNFSMLVSFHVIAIMIGKGHRLRTDKSLGRVQ